MRTKEEIEARHKKLASIAHMRQLPNKKDVPAKRKYKVITWKPDKDTLMAISENQKNVSRLRYTQKYVNEFQDKLIKQPTPYEEKLIHKLLQLKFDFDFQKPVVVKNKLYFIDIYIPYKNLAVEIDGGYHMTGEQIRLDKIREKHIRKVLRCKFIRFTNEQIEKDFYSCVKQIADYIGYELNH